MNRHVYLWSFSSVRRQHYEYSTKRGGLIQSGRHHHLVEMYLGLALIYMYLIYYSIAKQQSVITHCKQTRQEHIYCTESYNPCEIGILRLQNTLHVMLNNNLTLPLYYVLLCVRKSPQLHTRFHFCFYNKLVRVMTITCSLYEAVMVVIV